MQCETANVMPMLIFLVALVAAGCLRRNGSVAALAAAAGVAIVATLHCLFNRQIKELTLAHLMVGSLAFEGAMRHAKLPLPLIATYAELAFGLLCIFPNLMVTLTETCCPGLGARDPFGPMRSFEEYRHNKFFSKQHAFLHAAIVIKIASICTSFWPALRHSPRVQMSRIFIEPAMLVTVALILMTHDHGASTKAAHELDSHPVIGTLMCLTAFLHAVSAGVHLSYPTPTGAPPDLTVPLPGGGPAPLRLLRIVTCFAYLLLANFLFVDTFMEYLGCRWVLIKVGITDDDEARIGWNPSTEISTYKAAAVIATVLCLAFVIVPLAGDGPTATKGGEYAKVSAEEHTLLPLAQVRVEDADDSELTVEQVKVGNGSEGSAEGSA